MSPEVRPDQKLCFSCEKNAGYNRAIIELSTNREAGRLCVNCEQREFGNSLEYARQTVTDSCLFCERDAQYVLPRYLPFTLKHTTKTVSKVSTELEEHPVRLCDEHLFVLKNDTATTHTVDATHVLK